MWYITFTKGKSRENYVNRFFKNKTDAYSYIRNNFSKKSEYSDIEINNGFNSLVSNKINVGSTLTYNDKDTHRELGKIEQITEHLIFMRKTNGESVEFTKNTINKRYIENIISVKEKEIEDI